MAVNLGLTDVSSGYNRSAINDNFNTIVAALQDALSRSGNAPNQMGADIDLNGNDILNGGTATFSGIEVGGVDFLAAMQTIYDDYLNITQNVTVSTSAPSGGNDGDIWFKVSA